MTVSDPLYYRRPPSKYKDPPKSPRQLNSIANMVGKHDILKSIRVTSSHQRLIAFVVFSLDWYRTERNRP
jgi:hypothetical protein